MELTGVRRDAGSPRPSRSSSSAEVFVACGQALSQVVDLKRGWTEQEKWGSSPRFLASFGGEPNLCRTLRLIQPARAIVSVCPEFEKLTRWATSADLVVQQTPSKVHKYRTFLPWQGSGVVFLLGDVLYAEEDLLALRDSSPGTFLVGKGNKSWPELFGFKYSDEVILAMEGLKENCTSWDILGPNTPGKPFDVSKARFPVLTSGGLTDDYDTWEEYQELRRVWDAFEANGMQGVSAIRNGRRVQRANRKVNPRSGSGR